MEFSKEIISILDYLGHKFGIAIDWTSENVMPYLEELCGKYINYEIYTSIAWCVAVGVVMIIAGLIWGISSIAGSYSYIPEVSKFVFFLSLIIFIIVGTCQAFDIIECYTIPEKTILEYLKTLMDRASYR